MVKTERSCADCKFYYDDVSGNPARKRCGWNGSSLIGGFESPPLPKWARWLPPEIEIENIHEKWKTNKQVLLPEDLIYFDCKTWVKAER